MEMGFAPELTKESWRPRPAAAASSEGPVVISKSLSKCARLFKSESGICEAERNAADRLWSRSKLGWDWSVKRGRGSDLVVSMGKEEGERLVVVRSMTAVMES
jgi:hypothetical protein